MSYKTDDTNTCDKCGKELQAGDCFSAVNPATKEFVDYCYPNCIPKGMTNCGYCMALRKREELDEDYKCVHGCLMWPTPKPPGSKSYAFTITVVGTGTTVEEAWQDARQSASEQTECDALPPYRLLEDDSQLADKDDGDDGGPSDACYAEGIRRVR